MKEILFTSSILILVLGLLRYLLRGRINLHLQYALWLLVAVRLLVPLSLPAAPWSVLNAVPQGTDTATTLYVSSHGITTSPPPVGRLTMRRSPSTMTTLASVTFIPWEKRRLRKPTIQRFQPNRSMICMPCYGPSGWSAQR